MSTQDSRERKLRQGDYKMNWVSAGIGWLLLIVQTLHKSKEEKNRKSISHSLSLSLSLSQLHKENSRQEIFPYLIIVISISQI